MRRFVRTVPAQAPRLPLAESLSESMERWKENHRQNAIEDAAREREQATNKSSKHEVEEETEMAAPLNEAEPGVCFTLKTDSGVLSYKQHEDGTYTDFVRVAFDMMLAFNGSEIDPLFKKVIQKAMTAYENGDIDFFEEGDAEYDSVQEALRNAEMQAQQYEDAKKYVTSLPPTDKLALRILSYNATDSHVEKLLNKNTDFPPNVVHDIMHKHESFELPFEKAAELYVNLRMADVILSVKSNDKSSEATAPPSARTTIKKAAAKKTAASKSTKKTPNKHPAKPKHVLSGSEKLKPEDGIIEQ